MQLPILERTNVNDLETFIDFWSKVYYNKAENLYDEIIKKEMFSQDDIQQLFIWKNGMPLSNSKQISFNNKVNNKLEIINGYKVKDNWAVSNFQENFNNIKAVWKIFLLHIIKPNIYPIYDQNIHRGFNFVQGYDYKHISNTIPDREKEIFYFNNYLEFATGLKMNLRTVDKAFFSFGQFIRNNSSSRLIS